MLSDDISNIIKQLKYHFKKSDIIKLHHANAINKLNINNILEPHKKRGRSTGNCGGSQCEMRFNGCPRLD